MGFATARVLHEFEVATGVRLKAPEDAHPLPRRLRKRLRLPKVDLFKSAPADTTRFGGEFWVRISGTGDPDQGVRDDGFRGREIERGQDAGKTLIAASARRANVEVLFWPDATEADPDVCSAWNTLTAFLGRL